MYTYELKVGYSQTDEGLKMSIPAILDSFQDAATYESQQGKITMDYLRERDLVWLLSAWQIEFIRRPNINEAIRVTTFPYEFRNFLGYRNFLITTLNDEVLVKGNSIWTLIDTKKMHPAKTTPEIIAGYELRERLEMDYAPRKIDILEKMELKDSYTVRRCQIDSNHHVNNVEYVRMAMEYLSYGEENGLKVDDVSQIRVEYKNAAVMGDIIVPQVYSDSESVQVKLSNKENNTFAVVEFIK